MIENDMDRNRVDSIMSSRITRWSSMLEDRKLIEVRKEISRYFALSLDGQSFEEAYNELQRANHGGASTSTSMYLIDRMMVSSLKYEWGEYVTGLIKKCLFNH